MNQTQNNTRVQSFLEALRSRQVNIGSEEAGFAPFGGSPEGFVEKRRVEEARRAEFLATRQKEEVEVFSATKTSRERRLTEIHERLLVLSKRVERKDQEVRKVVIQQVVKPNRSDESFFDHIQRVLDLLSSRPNHSQDWLTMYRSRSKKVGVYWEQAKKGGTKYTQALDRNLATSVG